MATKICSNTKTFGGKIWKNLHSVSPYNIFNKKFKIASLEFFRQKNVHITLCKSKKISNSLSFQIFLITLHNFSSLRFKVQFFNQRSFSLSRFGLKNFLHKMIWTDFHATNTQHGKLCHVAEKKDLFQPFNTVLSVAQDELNENWSEFSTVWYSFRWQGFRLSWLHISFDVTLKRF